MMRLERLRDRLVSGIRNKRMMSELLKLKLEELTFDISVAKCIGIEQSYKDVKALQGGKEANPVDLLSKSKLSKKMKTKKELKTSEKRGSSSSKEPGDRSCYRCLGNHDHKSCPFLKEKCHHCNKTGHIARACKVKIRETQAGHPPIHYVDGNHGDSDDYLGSLEVNNVSDKDHVIWVKEYRNGRLNGLPNWTTLNYLPLKKKGNQTLVVLIDGPLSSPSCCCFFSFFKLLLSCSTGAFIHTV